MLNSNDAFVLFDKGQSYLWLGSGCSQQETLVSKRLISQFSKANNPVIIEEKSDADSSPTLEYFYQMLGGYKDYHKIIEKRVAQIDPILYLGGIRNNQFLLEKYVSFSQMDLP